VWYHALSSSAGPADHDWRAGGAAAEEGRPYWLDWPAQWEAGHGPVLRARGCDDGGAAAAVGQLSQLSEGVRVYRSKGCVVVSAPSPSFARLPVLTDISLCHACSCQEILRVETARQGFQGMALQRRAGRLGLLEQPGAPETGWVAPHILRRRAPAPPAPVSGFEPTAPQYARPQATRAVPPRPARRHADVHALGVRAAGNSARSPSQSAGWVEGTLNAGMRSRGGSRYATAGGTDLCCGARARVWGGGVGGVLGRRRARNPGLRC
jgi:hypothetical protein